MVRSRGERRKELQTSIPCVLMRGGTSKGPFFAASDLPSDPVLRDRVLLRVMGSPDSQQIDGVGGATTVTSKVAIVSPSAHPWAEVDYLFAQVEVERSRVDTAPSCGNMLAAVGPYALEQGLVQPDRGESRVRIRSVNTGSLVEAVVQTPDGHVSYEGDAVISGVPGSSSRIELHLTDVVGSKTGAMFPTGRRTDLIEGLSVSCVDVAVPMVLVPALEMGKTGLESKAELDKDDEFRRRLEEVRLVAGRRMGLGEVQDSVVPKVALVAPPRRGGQLTARYFTPRDAHPSFAALGAVCVSTAAAIPGTVASAVSSEVNSEVVIEHPSGSIETGVEIAMHDGELTVAARVVRSARRLFAGEVYLPASVWDGT